MANMPPGRNLDRGWILDIASYDVIVDVTGDTATFSSRAEVRFRCRQPGTIAFADLQPANIKRVVLNGADLDTTGIYRSGHLELPRLAAENSLVVQADFSYVSAGAGLHRLTGPGGSACAYSRAYPGGAPRIYCCFDQPGSRAPVTLSVKAPAGSSCLANGPVTARPEDGEAGLWTFAATPPIPPYLFSFCSGPFARRAFTCSRGQGLPLPVTVNALPAAAAILDIVMNSVLACQPVAYYERGVGVPYPYAKCDFVFVPGYPGLAFGAPGLVTIGEHVLTKVHDGEHGLYLPTVIAHELAHAWFGGLIQFQPGGDEWLEEAITTYVSRSALEAAYPQASPWSAGTSQALPDHAYAADAATVKRLEAVIGQQAVFKGLHDLLRRPAHGWATRDDLVECWSRASERNLRGWAADTLMPAGSGH
jgi:aminopeptidase N